MFVLHDFVMATLRGMVGSEPPYKIRQYALAWYDKAELTDVDMEELDLAVTPPVTAEQVAEVLDTMLTGGDSSDAPTTD